MLKQKLRTVLRKISKQLTDTSLVETYANEFKALLDYQYGKSKDIELNQIYALILSMGKDRLFNLYSPYLEHVYNQKVGQITLESDFGVTMHEILCETQGTLLEFGCWNGLGSTLLACESTKNNITSIELNPVMVSVCINNLQPFPENLTLLHGRVIDTKDFLLNSSVFFSPEFLNSNILLGALIEIVLLHSSPKIINLLPPTFDHMLFDGGGFMSQKEFLCLYDRCRDSIFLDDISGIKCQKIFDFLNNSSSWKLLKLCKDRDSAIFKRNL